MFTGRERSPDRDTFSESATKERKMMQSAARIKKEKMKRYDDQRKSNLPEQVVSLEQRMRAEGLLPKAQ